MMGITSNHCDESEAKHHTDEHNLAAEDMLALSPVGSGRFTLKARIHFPRTT
jgi:hypothetical protein